MFNRYISALAVLAWVVAGPPGRAQTNVNSVRIYTDPAAAAFTVDGQSFLNSATLLWPANSKHVVTSYDQTQTVPGTGYLYKGWVSNLSATISKQQPITADPGLQWIKLLFDVSYLVTIDLINCPDPSQPCATTGTVTVNSVPYDRRTQIYLPATGTVEVRAYPGNGYIFAGWGPIYGLPTKQTAFVVTFPLLGPTQLSANFQPANAVQTQVNIVTEPPQLAVLLDRTPYTAPINLEWGWDTVHAVGANPVQVAQGVTYVFDSWSDGGPINHDYRVPAQSGAITLRALFVAAATVGFQTSPAGLQLSVDGQQKWPSYNFAWAPGSTHQISAPATQTDAQGHKYKFVSWSNGQSAAFTYTTGPAPGDDHLTATYQAVGQATISSAPAGMTVQVDGSDCTTPCVVEKEVGASVVASVPQVRANGDQSRMIFQGWGDLTDLTRKVTVTADSKTYTATYNLQNRLSLSSTPANGATFLLSPSSTDGFYDASTMVSVSARLALGFRVTRWSGDISGTATGVTVMLDAPKSAALVLDPVPAIAPGRRSQCRGGCQPGQRGPRVPDLHIRCEPGFRPGDRTAQSAGPDPGERDRPQRSELPAPDLRFPGTD